MEQRRESRLGFSKAATLKVVSLMGKESAGVPLHAHVLDVSGSGMRVEVSRPVPCGATVEITDRHTRILGETLRCDPKSDGYIVAVSVLETTPLADDFATPRA